MRKTVQFPRPFSSTDKLYSLAIVVEDSSVADTAAKTVLRFIFCNLTLEQLDNFSFDIDEDLLLTINRELSLNLHASPNGFDTLNAGDYINTVHLPLQGTVESELISLKKI